MKRMTISQKQCDLKLTLMMNLMICSWMMSLTTRTLMTMMIIKR